MFKQLNQNGHSYLSSIVKDNKMFPNNKYLPAIILPDAFPASPKVDPVEIERAFYRNKWEQSWRNGLFSFHHYHSRAHEVLGVYSGWVRILLGGPEGIEITASAGDVLILPAGVSHKNLDQAADFYVLGAYPRGQIADMKYGKEGERPEADYVISSVPLPEYDPVYGKTGPLMMCWNHESSYETG